MKSLKFLFFIGLIFMGCDIESTITYSVVNKSSKQIKVVFYNTNGKDRLTYEKRDSVLIEIDSAKIIVIQSKGNKRVALSKENDTYLREFKYLEIYQQNLKSKVDFLLSNKWDYVELNKHNAEYKCIVTQSDF